MGFESCLRKLFFLNFLFVIIIIIKFKNKTKQCHEGRMEDEVTESFKRKFLIPEILDKLSGHRTNEILVRWGMTAPERMAGKLGEKNEMRRTLMRGNRSWKG